MEDEYYSKIEYYIIEQFITHDDGRSSWTPFSVCNSEEEALDYLIDSSENLPMRVIHFVKVSKQVAYSTSGIPSKE